MTEENPQPNPVLAWVQDHQVPSIFIGLGVLVILGLLLSAVLGEDSEIVTVEITMPSDSAPTSTATGSADSDGPEVPPVDCLILLTDDEIDEALFGPDASGPRSHFTFAEGETCLYEPDDESGHYIKIEPGHPSDFDPDPRPVTVDEVGDAALWFDNGTDMGALSVGVNVPDASLIYRIHIGRPDLSSEQRLAQATELALLALPRFPGAPQGPPKPLVDFCEMVPDEQAEEILAEYRDAHPATLDEVRVSNNSMGLAEHDLSEEGDPYCRKLILSEIYIEAQHGSLADFEDGARMEGVPAERVEGVGDEAVWFPNVPYQGSFTAPHERGVLSVRVGDAMFRIVIAVPDTPSDDQLEIVRRLAAGALAQIPGVEAPELEPQVVTFADEPPDLPPFDLEDVLLDGVADGTWTVGEGLVVLLDWLANRTPGVMEVDLPNRSASSILLIAQAYAAAGHSDSAEVRALLEQVITTRDELRDQMELSGSAAARNLLVSAIPIAQEEPADPCGVPTSATPDLKEFGMDEYEDLDAGQHKVFLAVSSKWTEADVCLVKQALHDSLVAYAKIGLMPSTWVDLNPGGTLHASVSSEGCLVDVGDFLVGEDPGDLKQILAREIAVCFISSELLDQLKGKENSVTWLVFGLANYLSGTVYPNNNLEHQKLPLQLAQQELATTIPGRTWTNWILFEHLHGFMGADGIMSMARGFPEKGDLVSALAAVTGMDEMYHDLERALSDSEVSDVGAGTVPYDPPAWDLVVSGPLEVPVTVPQFGVRRIHITVPSGKYACADSFSQGQVRMSWRPGAPGQPGSWSDELPDSFEGENVIVLSSVKPGAHYTLDVYAVSNEPDCEEDEDEVRPTLPPPSERERCNIDCGPSRFYHEPGSF